MNFTKLTDQLDKLPNIEKTYWNAREASLTIYYDETITKDIANVRIQKYLTESGMRNSVDKITFISTEKGTFQLAKGGIKGKEEK